MSNQLQFSGKYSSNKHKIDVQLPFISFEDSGSIVCYCPALDIAGYGKTYEDALQSLHITLRETLHLNSMRYEQKQKQKKG